MKLSVSDLFFIVSIFIYMFIYLFCAVNFMHNINIIHRSFFPTALPHRLPFLFLALPVLALPVSLPCLIPCPAYFLALPISLHCLCPCPAYFLDLPMPTSFCLCLLPMPFSSAFCLFNSLFFFSYIYKKKCILHA